MIAVEVFFGPNRGLGFMNPAIRLFFMTGDFGALTTFSTFGLETVNAFREENISSRRPIFLPIMSSVLYRFCWVSGGSATVRGSKHAVR